MVSQPLQHVKRIAKWLVVVWVLFAVPAVQGQHYPGVKCPVEGTKQCRVAFNVDYGGGKIYFSSQRAAADFRAAVVDCNGEMLPMAEGYILKANHQLTLTGQVEQIACPSSGKALGATGSLMSTARVSIAGAIVRFYDIEAAEKFSADFPTTWLRAKALFSPPVFSKAFRPVGIDQQPDNQNGRDAPAANVARESTDASSR